MTITRTSARAVLALAMTSATVTIGGCATPATITVAHRGEAPSLEQALNATHKHLRRALNDYDSMKSFAVVRGPDPVAATNAAGNLEEVWLLCVEYNAKNLYGAYTGLKEHPVALRLNSQGEAEVIAPTNWINYRDRC